MSQADDLLRSYLDADRALRRARVAFIALGETPDVLGALTRGVDKAFLAHDAEADEAGSVLVRIADVLEDLANAEATRLLLRILGHEDTGVRSAAGEALIERLYDRYTEVARIIEAEIDRGGNAVALAEVPFILAEVGEAAGVKLVTKLLKHADADVAGAAVEALAAMGDPSVLEALEPLRNDKRKVSVDEDDESVGEVTVGDLVSGALEQLRGLQHA